MRSMYLDWIWIYLELLYELSSFFSSFVFSLILYLLRQHASKSHTELWNRPRVYTSPMHCHRKSIHKTPMVLKKKYWEFLDKLWLWPIKQNRHFNNRKTLFWKIFMQLNCMQRKTGKILITRQLRRLEVIDWNFEGFWMILKSTHIQFRRL